MLKRRFAILLTVIYMAFLASSVSFAGTMPISGANAAEPDSGVDIVIGNEAGVASKVPAPEISAPSAILVEAETGQILYEKESRIPLHISAACKIMTTLVAIENADLSSYVTVSSDSARPEGSALNLEIGAKYKLTDLLYATMLTSANDTALAIADHVSSGKIDRFIDKMNETAARLGMHNTHFANPTGLLDIRQFTTAEDFALLIKYAIKNPTFNSLFSARSRPWYGTGSRPEILTNSNQLFWSYEGVEGGKVGYNNKDQQTVVSTALRTNVKLICVVLDAPETTMYTDATTLFDYGFSNFWKSTLVSKGELLKTADLDGKPIRLISQSDIMYMHPIGENYIREFTSTAELTLPLKTTIPAGTATYILDDGTEVNISLYPETEIIPPDDTWTKFRKSIVDNKDIFILIIVLLVFEGILLLFNLGKLFGKLYTYLMNRSSQKRRID
ncbi:MAG: D-alanyl-D-alanine carboxypeptidase [Clostridiaceae bacterium]|nr:D-alanyl-D-alanine carboxypeptidase [Clostridiaceae bacterium]